MTLNYLETDLFLVMFIQINFIFSADLRKINLFDIHYQGLQVDRIPVFEECQDKTCGALRGTIGATFPVRAEDQCRRKRPGLRNEFQMLGSAPHYETRKESPGRQLHEVLSKVGNLCNPIAALVNSHVPAVTRS